MVFIAVAVLRITNTDYEAYSILRDTIGNIAAITIICGGLLRSWAGGCIMKNKALMTTGPYHLCRNPLYLGSFMIAMGFAVILRDVMLWAMFVTFFLMYIPTIKAEEQKLARLFPDEFSAYIKATGILFPKSFSLKKLKSHWSLKRWWQNTEYNAMIAIIVAFTIIEYLWAKP